MPSTHMRLPAELGLEVRQVGSARTGPARIAALRHEAWNHAVEHDAIVKAAVGEFGDALNVTRGKVRAKLDDDVATTRKAKGQAVVGHHSLHRTKGRKCAI